MKTLRVPDYARYGEHHEPADAALVHCQPIFSRISEQNWEIRPHRHSHLWQLFLLVEGRLDTVLELERVTLTGPCVLLVPAGRIHGFAYGDGVKGTMVSVSASYLRRILEEAGGGSLRWKSDSIYTVPLHGHHGSALELRRLFDAINRESSQRRPGFVPALASLLRLLFVQLHRLHGPGNGFGNLDEQGAAFERFRELVAEHLKNHLAVADYCRDLGIGERRLNRVCRALIGESPLSYIHGQLVEEAKRCLVHTAMPITSVGYELGFRDAAYFSRFFKKHTGVSPSTYAARYRE